MVEVIFDPLFEKEFKKIKDNSLKDRVIKQFSKIKDSPEAGKPMRYDRKGTRERYIPPLRLFYKVGGDTIYVLALYHKDEQ